MFKHHIITAVRLALRQRGYTFINLLGLSLGLALFTLILLYIKFEFSHDTFHEKASQIYRVEEDLDGRGRRMAFSHVALGPKLITDYPEIISYTRFAGMGGNQLLSVGALKFNEQFGWWADENFLKTFNFPLVQGNAITALSEPFSIVLSESLAEKYFPDSDPLGSTIRLNNRQDYKVTGIIIDRPTNTHIRYNFLISYSSYPSIAGQDYFENWRHISNYTYVILEKNTDLAILNDKIKHILQTTIHESHPSHVILKPLSQIHFHSNVIAEIGRRGDLNRVLLLGAIGIFIILIASINYMNLATARSSRRAKEIGLRKVTGASRPGLIIQFLMESVLFSFSGLIIAWIWTALAIPEFSAIMQRNLDRSLLLDPVLIGTMTGIAIVIGLISGSYPALYLSKFLPVTTLKGQISNTGKSSIFRKTLVILQFGISIGLIICSLVIQSQMNYIQDRDLGITPSNVLVTEFIRMDQETRDKYEVLKQTLLQNPNVENVAVSQHLPTNWGYSATVVQDWEGRNDEDEGIYTYLNQVDQNFFDTFGITILEGRIFSLTESQESLQSCIINETAAKEFGFSEPIGKRIGENMQVIGLVKDFHFSTMRDQIAPLIFRSLAEPRPGARARNGFSVKIASNQPIETQRFIEEKAMELFSLDIIQFRQFEDDIDRMYGDEHRTAKTFGFFSFLAITIAGMGLFGLASFTASQRFKEIGIRKVLGASVGSIVIILIKEFTKWVLLANILAWPIAYWSMNQWLNHFAYRTSLHWWIFLLAAIGAFIIAIATVSFQSVKAALADPVDSLRYE